jgi:hypothetical protein
MVVTKGAVIVVEIGAIASNDVHLAVIVAA